MDDGDGGFSMELQAKRIANNAIRYKGSAPCPQCGIVMNPVEFMYSKGICPSCHNNKMATRVKGKMA
jgi:Zn finger protein HypA/HybF involved in hydrogenase expression